MNVDLSHIKQSSTLPDHYDTRSTVGSLEDRKGPRESTDEHKEAARLAYRNAARRNICVITLCRKGPKVREKIFSMTTRGSDHGHKWSNGVLENLGSWFPKFIPREKSSVCGVIRPYTMTSETRVYWTSMAAILAICWRGNLKFIVRYLAWQTEHSDLLHSD
jgi:hypothetical protein